jgi:hypothetical protein|tara:strand:+ start:630 stop:4118 length:3489 start_codon:yes stop_codon:yes gene_type:complete
MDTLNDLISALTAAHEAGDTQNASILANEIKRQEAVAELTKSTNKANAIANLTGGNPYPEKVEVGRPPPSIPSMGATSIPVKRTPLTPLSKQQWYTQWYEKNLSVILQDNNPSFDFENGLSDDVPRTLPELPQKEASWLETAFSGFTTAPVYTSGSGLSQPTASGSRPRTGISDRANYGMMPTRETQMAWLKQEFGEDNVQYFQTPGHDLFLWRKGKDDPWKMPEPVETIDFADFTSDLAGEVIPTVTSTAGGLAGIKGGPVGVAVGTGLGQGFGRGLQEYLVEKTLLDEVDTNRILKKAAVEGVLTGLVDFGFQKGTNIFFKSILGREGTDLFAKEMTQYNLIASQGTGESVYTPKFLQQGGDVAQDVLRMENRFPGGTASQGLDVKRTQAGETFQNLANPARYDEVTSDDSIRLTLDSIKTDLMDQRKKLEVRLRQLDAEGKAISPEDPRAIKIKAEEEALSLFDERIARYEANVLASRNVSPAEAGDVLRDDLANMFADVSVRKGKMFEQAYENLADVSAPLSDLQRVFSRHSEELLTDVEVDALQVLNANARKTSQGVIRRLDELEFNDGSIDFKALNEIIQKLEEKTKRGNFAKGFEANQYTALADDLRIMRTEMLEGADPLAKQRFDDANLYFRETYLRYVGGDVGSMIKPRTGSNYNQALAARRAPVEFKVTNDVNPNYAKGSGDRKINGYKVKTQDGNDYYIKPDPSNPDPNLRFLVYSQDRNGLPNMEDLVSGYRTKGDAVASLERIEPADVGTFLPEFKAQDDIITGKILTNSGTARDFLELSGGNPQTRNLLRDAWLENKGLVAGEPINLDKILKMSPEDMDMIRVLYPDGQRPSPKAGVAGWNDKVEVFRELKKLATGKDKNIAEISAQTFDRIFKSNSTAELAQLKKIARGEQLITQRLEKHSQVMVKMAVEGRVPLPQNRVEMKTFLSGLMNATPAEQTKFIALFDNAVDSKALDELQGAVFHEMVRRTRVDGNLTSASSPKDNILWDPFVMARELEDNLEIVTALVGREGYKNMVSSNKVLMNLTRPSLNEAGDQMVPRVAASMSGFRIWLGNVAAPVTDRWGSMMLSMQSRFPVTKQVIDAKQYDKYQNALMRTILLSRRGHELMDSEVSDSPEMSKFVHDQLDTINKESDRLRLDAFPNNTDPIQ